MEELVKLINKAFDGNYFECVKFCTPISDENSYNINVRYIPKNTFVQKTKFYYENSISDSTIKNVEESAKEQLIRNILFSKETDNKYFDGIDGSPIKMFADYKKEIPELNKNKVNE